MNNDSKVAPRELMEMTHLGDPGYCFLCRSGLAFVLYYRLLLRKTGKDTFFVPKGLAFEIDCTVAEAFATYKSIYDRWFHYFLSKNPQHLTAFRDTFCQLTWNGWTYKPTVAHAVNSARDMMEVTWDRTTALLTLEALMRRGEVSQPQLIFWEHWLPNLAVWDGVATERPEQPQYVSHR